MSLEKYTGHKKLHGVYQKIINNIPAHSIYYELFAGSASIFSLITVPAGTVILNDINTNVADQLKKLFPDHTVTSDCALQLLQSNQSVLAKETFIFLDPPYLHSTRHRNNYYDYELTDQQHIDLLENICKMNCNIMMIHPKCELYDKMLGGWKKVEIKLRYQGKTSIECLYMNYDNIPELQSDSYLGADCWDRQRIKRKGDRLIAKLMKLPVLEKNYVLNRLKEIK